MSQIFTKDITESYLTVHWTREGSRMTEQLTRTGVTFASQIKIDALAKNRDSDVLGIPFLGYPLAETSFLENGLI
jgi:hypothetical protein